MRVLSNTAWSRTGPGKNVITTFVAVLFMVLSRHYLPSVHNSADNLVSKYAPEIHIERPPLQKAPYGEFLPNHAKTTDSGSRNQDDSLPVHRVPSSTDFPVSMKTGATEFFAKHPEQFLTTLRCVPNYKIFSDLEQDMGYYHIYSSLRTAGFESDAEGRWCDPALSWQSHDVEALWQFETKLLVEGERFYNCKDLFHQLVEPHSAAIREDWDNLSRDRIYIGSSGLHPDEGRRFPLKASLDDVDDEERVNILRDLNEEQRGIAVSSGYYTKEMRWDELAEEGQVSAWEALED
ncbi:hypothetical protein LTR62_005685 [Meristemomyces frigidus]|uniref:Uncharacterized protein n=1 Tax=Meristemomyces frigidus TaxID=1508187 RepID=A0AAN7YQH9_9PEZI|nr:hypothetical protein LTR62_005685 [Meristemomyces frigidus]